MLRSLLYILPEIFILSTGTILLIALQLLFKREEVGKLNNSLTPNITGPTSFLIIILSIIYFFLIFYTPPNFSELWGLYSNEFIYLLRLIIASLFIFYLFFIRTEVKSNHFYSYEFYIIQLFSFISLNLILISSSFLNIFIFVELFSLCSYYLVVSHKKSKKSLEAGIKFFIFGSIASIFFLFGIFLLYFSTGLTDLNDLFLLTSTYTEAGSLNYFFGLASLLIIISLLFKVGGGFYYFWLIDVYDGIDYPVLILLNIFAKLVYIYLIFTFLYTFNAPLLGLAAKVFILLSLFIGAIGAIYQIKIKLFIIFSSLYNLSLFSISLWNFDPTFKTTFLLFTLLYSYNTFSLVVAFASLKDWVNNITIKRLEDLTALLKQNKPYALLFLFITLTSAGLPPLSIFAGKFFIFFEISRVLNLLWVFIFIVSSAFAFFYYIRLAKLLLQNTKNINFFLKPIKPVIAYLLSFTIIINLFLLVYYKELLILLNIYC